MRKFMVANKKYLILQWLSPGVETGRQASLRGWCSQGRASSSLVLGTQKNRLETIGFFYIPKIHPSIKKFNL